jgi:hypothetical protein
MAAVLTTKRRREPSQRAPVPPLGVNDCSDAALAAEATPGGLSGDRLLACEAMRLLMRLDAELRYARADFNQDRFRRLMQARPKAVIRLQRRWVKLDPQPLIPLGSLRRRYHANLAGYLYQPRQ